jgi:hypothetical protein
VANFAKLPVALREMKKDSDGRPQRVGVQVSYAEFTIDSGRNVDGNHSISDSRQVTLWFLATVRRFTTELG